MSSLLIAVPRSSARAISAPVAGSAVSTANFRPAYEPARPPRSLIDGELAHELGQLVDVELADAPAVRRQRVRTRLGVVEEGVDTFGAPAVDQGLEVPGDVGGGAVCFGGGGVEVMSPPFEVRGRALRAAARRARRRGDGWRG